MAGRVTARVTALLIILVALVAVAPPGVGGERAGAAPISNSLTFSIRVRAIPRPVPKPWPILIDWVWPPAHGKDFRGTQ